MGGKKKKDPGRSVKGTGKEKVKKSAGVLGGRKG